MIDPYLVSVIKKMKTRQQTINSIERYIEILENENRDSPFIKVFKDAIFILKDDKEEIDSLKNQISSLEDSLYSIIESN